MNYIQLSVYYGCPCPVLLIFETVNDMKICYHVVKVNSAVGTCKS